MDSAGPADTLIMDKLSMISREYFTLRRHERTLWIEYRNPPVNFFNMDACAELHDIIRAVDRDPSLRVLILTGGFDDRYIYHLEPPELAEVVEWIGDSPLAALSRNAITGPLLRGATALTLFLLRNWPTYQRLMVAFGRKVRRRFPGIYMLLEMHATYFAIEGSQKITIAAMNGSCNGPGPDTAACFDLSAFAFLPSMLVLLTLTVDRALPAQKRDSAIRTLVDGYQYIWKFPTLRSLLSVDLVPVIFGMSFFTLLPALTRDVYDRGAEGLGFLYAADGAGAFIGVMIIAAMTSLRRRGFWVIVFVFLFAVIQILFSFAPTLYIGMVFIFGLGLVSAIYGTLADTLIQTIVHDEFRGRVMAVYSTFWGLTPIGYLQIGIIAQHWGTQRAILVNACVVLLYVLALIKWNPEVRRLN